MIKKEKMVVNVMVLGTMTCQDTIKGVTNITCEDGIFIITATLPQNDREFVIIEKSIKRFYLMISEVSHE